MNPETVSRLRERLTREVAGLQKMDAQLADPETGTTPGGLKSGLVILTRALLRTNQAMLDLTRALEAAPPPANPFEQFGRLFK